MFSLTISYQNYPALHAANYPNTYSDAAVTDSTFPSAIECVPQPVYRHRPDGKPGREIKIILKNSKLFDPAVLTIECEGIMETIQVPANAQGTSELTILLPEGASVSKDCLVKTTLKSEGRQLTSSTVVPFKRQWTVFLYTHSHVDIGYTQSQDVVKKITARNLINAMNIAKQTESYPEGARYIWNTEAVWATENFLREATPEQKIAFIEAVKKGQVALDANYASFNTSVCSDEELLRIFQAGLRINKLTGIKSNTMVQIDVPGISWGMAQAAAQYGIKGIIDFPNSSYHNNTLFQRPFYFVAPDGKTKVLYIEGPQYDLGWYWKASKIKPSPYPTFENPADGWIQDYPAVMDFIKTKNPSENFIPISYLTKETDALEKEGLPYDYFTMTWSMSDNSILDADLPDAVKAWNEEYAYPRLVISSGKEIIEAYEKKFGNMFPERHGDLTEYWTDGLGSDALHTGYNRLAKERLSQAEITWTMLNPRSLAKAPLSNIYDSWQWILLGSEHTWGYWKPERPISKTIEAVKASYFENADKTSREILEETLQPITSPESNTIAVLNALSWPRTGLVTLTEQQIKAYNGVMDYSGKLLPSQRLSTGELVFLANEIPALGSRTFQLLNTKNLKPSTLMASDSILENSLIKVVINKQTGDIVSLFDKHTSHEFVNSKSPFALNSYRYVIGRDSSIQAGIPTEVTVSIKENGPVVASLKVESKAPGCKSLSREIRIIANQPQVEIINILDKISTTTKESVHFGFAFDVPDGTIRFDIPWGVMNPQTEQLPGGANQNFLAFQRWIDVTNSQYGVAWTCIEMPLVELGGITINRKSSRQVEDQYVKNLPFDNRTIVSYALNNQWHVNFPMEQGGIIPFHYAILPHGTYDPVVTNRFGMEQNRPLVAVLSNKNPVKNPLVSIDNPRVFISALNPSEDGKAVMLRLRSLSDQPETAILSFPAGSPKSVNLSDTLEGVGAKKDNTIYMHPYGVITIRMEF